MRIWNLIILGGLLLFVAGCGGGAEKQARTAGGNEAVGGQTRKARPPATPPPPRKIDCDRVKCVSLTFDDGPGPHTARLLDTLKVRGVRATFFMLGEVVQQHAGVVRRMALEGHEVANHTWSHPDLTGLSPKEVRSQIERTQKAIRNASGVAPTLMRPPYGATNDEVGRLVGMPQILWSVDTRDWQFRSVGRDAKVGITKPERGGIVLYHDVHKESVDSIPKVVVGLKKRGFTLVTVTEMFRGERLKPGETYTEDPVEAEPLTASPTASPAPGSPTGTAPEPSPTGPSSNPGQ
ncbi:polysaccharide deacetylase family protein [Actinomadura sp. KC345]|uniref:polysaccharide deacetylase family protein n=1 Tax=Actinomadura sp. KC345 TaxID=2530371 RepID=UPI001FB5F2C1|nr:polysaccharide deacetylase family protein [Actinomadura sp. KC345]